MHNDTAYEFKGSLEFLEIERIILSKEFIEKANDADSQKNFDGITFKNFLYYPKFKLSRAYNEDLGFDGNIRRGFKKYTTQLFLGVELFAKTFGVRRLITSDENILPFCIAVMAVPFLLFILAIVIENTLLFRPPVFRAPEKIKKE